MKTEYLDINSSGTYGRKNNDDIPETEYIRIDHSNFGWVYPCPEYVPTALVERTHLVRGKYICPKTGDWVRDEHKVKIKYYFIKSWCSSKEDKEVIKKYKRHLYNKLGKTPYLIRYETYLIKEVETPVMVKASDWMPVCAIEIGCRNCDAEFCQPWCERD